jgi:hypothetical protein
VSEVILEVPGSIELSELSELISVADELRVIGHRNVDVGVFPKVSVLL